MDPRSGLIAAAHALAGEGLVNAFGHVSVRLDDGTIAMTPAAPLGAVSRSHDFPVMSLDADDLPPGMPREAWAHVAVMKARPDVGAVCRAQPESVAAVTAAGLPIRPLHGQGSFVGDVVPVFGDPRLVRDAERAGRLADVLGTGNAVVMRGNGAVTTGATIGEAVARMWVLEKSARLNAMAAAAGTPEPLTAEEQEAWCATSTELLNRIWYHLTAQNSVPTTHTTRSTP